MSIRAAGGFKAGVRSSEACVEQTLSRLNKCLIRSPAARGEALFVNETQPISGSAQIFFFAKNKIRLHGGTQRIHVTVGVLADQHIVALGKWAQVILLDEAPGKIAVFGLSTAKLSN